MNPEIIHRIRRSMHAGRPISRASDDRCGVAFLSVIGVGMCILAGAAALTASEAGASVPGYSL